MADQDKAMKKEKVSFLEGKWSWILIAVLWMAALGMIAAIILSPEEETAESEQLVNEIEGEVSEAEPGNGSDDQADFETVDQWTGEDDKATNVFSTETGEWRISWKAYDEVFEGAGILQIFVNDADGSMLDLVVNETGPSEGNTYVRTTPGD